MKSIFPIITVSLILFFALFLRTYRLSELPNGMYWDEAAILYDAYSIQQTGMDHTRSVPFTYLKSFGDYKNPLYVYLTSFALNFSTSPSVWDARIVSVLSGVLFILLLFGITYLLTHNRTLSLITVLLASVSPWGLFLSRGGFESNLFLCLTTLAIFSFLLFVEKGNKVYLYLSSVLFGLTFFSYHSAKITTPLILLLLVVLFTKKIFINKIRLFIAIGLFSLLTLPFLTPSSLQNTIFRLDGVSTIAQDEINNNAHFQLEDSHPALDRWFHMGKFIRVKTVMRNFALNLSPEFLFFSGDPNVRHSLPGFGQMYLFEMLTLLVGFYALYKAQPIQNPKYRNLLLALIVIGTIPSAISVNAPHALRVSLLTIPLLIISSLGIYELFQLRFSFKILSVLKNVITFVIIIFNISLFLHTYFAHYSQYSQDWQYGYKEAISVLQKNNWQYKEVIFTNQYAQSLWYLAVYLPIEPAEFQSLAKVRYGENGKFWETLGEFKNVKVVDDKDIKFYLDHPKPNQLIVATGRKWESIPVRYPIIYTVYSPKGEPVFDIFDTNLLKYEN